MRDPVPFTWGRPALGHPRRTSGQPAVRLFDAERPRLAPCRAADLSIPSSPGLPDGDRECPQLAVSVTRRSRRLAVAGQPVAGGSVGPRGHRIPDQAPSDPGSYTHRTRDTAVSCDQADGCRHSTPVTMPPQVVDSPGGRCCSGGSRPDPDAADPVAAADSPTPAHPRARRGLVDRGPIVAGRSAGSGRNPAGGGGRHTLPAYAVYLLAASGRLASERAADAVLDGRDDRLCRRRCRRACIGRGLRSPSAAQRLVARPRRRKSCMVVNWSRSALRTDGAKVALLADLIIRPGLGSTSGPQVRDLGRQLAGGQA